MSSLDIQWACSQCGAHLENKRSQHEPCHAHTKWTCPLSGQSGLYKNYKRHVSACVFCSPDDIRQIVAKETADKENRITAVLEDEQGEEVGTHRCLPLPTTRHTCMLISSPCVCEHITEHPQHPWSTWSVTKGAMRSWTGLEVEQMETVFEMCKERLAAMRMHMRQKDPNIPPFSPHNILAITVYWMRQYPSFDHVALEFGHNSSYHKRMVAKVVHIMDECIVRKLIHPLSSTAPTSSLSSLSNVKIIVDTTFVPLPKTPYNPTLYHPKSPTKTAWKYEIACDFRHRIINVSKGYSGPAHDMRIIRESGLLDQASSSALIIGDKGYDGPLGIITPLKKNRKRSKEAAQLEDERVRRHELESERAAIENINARAKEWKCVKGQWRGEHHTTEFYDAVMRVACALTNLIFEAHPIRAGRQGAVKRATV
jgi:hypothetical protein